MAIEVMERVLASTVSPASSKLVLLALANHCDARGGSCYPSLQSIADESSISRDQARRVVNSLVAAGLVSVTGRTGGAHAPRYQLNLEAIAALRRPERRAASAELEPREATGGTHATPTHGIHATPTGGAGATPAGSADAPTGGVGATGGVASAPSTGGTGATRTVKNLYEPGEADSVKGRRRKQRAEVTFAEWLAALPPGERPVPEGDGVFLYAERIDLPPSFLHLAWLVFRARFIADDQKRQRCWRKTFQNYVQRGYLGLWRLDSSGQYQLTTAGHQAEREHRHEELAA